MIERIGILGGGQLAQMLTQAAISLGLSCVIFEREADSPASRLTGDRMVGPWDDEATCSSFARRAQIITLENEFVDIGVLKRFESWNIPVYPSSHTLSLIQDKLIQKQTLAEVGIPVPDFEAVDSPEQIVQWGEAWGWPVVLKARRNGYDGRGNATVRNPDEAAGAWEQLGGDRGRTLYVERFVPFTAELAVMVARSSTGEVSCYPVVQTEQKNHICHRVFAPAPISPELSESARSIAQRAIETIDGVGIFGVELFLLDDPDKPIVLNELAPRPHNSGHYTMEACVTSQFENHLRAVMGLPLGDCSLRAPAAVMVNLLGERNGRASEGEAPFGALAVAGAHLHLYGKREVRVGRKMGHITVLADSLDEAIARANQAVEQTAL
jgi:5-(carboxyamino)imidazole ribonucleotide synthase